MRQITFTPHQTSTGIEILSNVCESEFLKSKISDGIDKENKDGGIYLCDLGEVISKHKIWLKTFSNIQSYYSVRCNKDQTFIKWLISMDVGFCCVNKAEMKLLIDLGANPVKIIYGNPCKQSSHIRFAASVGIKRIEFDSFLELKKLKKNYPESELILRIAIDDSESANSMNMKYGASLQEGFDLLSKSMELEMNVAGISFYPGDECKDAEAYVQGINRAKVLFDFASSIGIRMSILNIGGDFYATEKQEYSFAKIGNKINESLSKTFSSETLKNLEVIATPGRFYAETSFTICTNVIAKKKVDISDEDLSKADVGDNCKFMYYINEGVYGAFNLMFTESGGYEPTPLKLVANDIPLYPSNVWGPTCDGMDKVCNSRYFPELEVGDWLIWKDMGAYSMEYRTQFNGFKTCCIYYYISQDNMVEMKSMFKSNQLCAIKPGCEDLEKICSAYFPDKENSCLDVKASEELVITS